MALGRSLYPRRAKPSAMSASVRANIAFVAFVAFVGMTTMAGASEMAENRTGVITSFGEVQVNPADLSVAIAEGEAALAAARNTLGLRNFRFAIIEATGATDRWGDISAAGDSIFVWPFASNRRPGFEPPPTFLLRHEIGHSLFIRYLVPSSRADQYGGDAPDWLDEMAALAFEGEPLRTMRRRSAARHAADGTLIPLQRLLTMTHPEFVGGALPDSLNTPGGTFEARAADTASYYAVTAALYEYLVDRTGNRAIVAELAEAFRAGEQLDHWLPTRAGFGGGAAGLNALNESFQSWVSADPRYGGVRAAVPDS